METMECTQETQTDASIQSSTDPGLDSETTGLAFSPDNTIMYVAYQGDGIIFEITRDEGYTPFGAHRLDIKYHA